MMIRPIKEDYHIDTVDYQNTYIGKYVIELENYCDELEKALEKALDKACAMLEYKSTYFANNEPYFCTKTKEKWKEWCLKNE